MRRGSERSQGGGVREESVGGGSERSRWGEGGVGEESGMLMILKVLFV